MQGTGRKITFQDSGKCSQSKSEDGAKIISLLKSKKNRKILQNKKKRPSSKSHVQPIISTCTERPVKSSSKGSRNGSTSGKLTGRKFIHKKLSTKPPKKSSSSSLGGGKTSLTSSKGDEENTIGDVKISKLKRRRKKKRIEKEKVELDDASRLQRRTRYLLFKMKPEQNLIDAYSGEGWKGQSREKIKPEKELQRAQKQILKCKLGIRDAIRQLHMLSSVGCIEDSVISPDGSVYHEHIFCAKCKSREAFPDNDIILCDGTCNCAFHQKCLDPPLHTENRDQGWFCKFCECKMEILEAVNAHLGTHFSMNSTWEDVFKEEAACPDGENALLNQGEEWPSDDSDDDDYNPDNKERNYDNSGEASDEHMTDDSCSSTSLSWSLEDEDFAEKERIGCGEYFSVGTSAESVDTEEEVIRGPRQRRDVDYKKLYDEMFGKDAPAYEQISEDEDWGPSKRRRREKESDAASTLMTLCGSEEKRPDVNADAEGESGSRRHFFRIPPNAVEKLRQVFADNELPSREVKENLSKELGLNSEKVSKWFKNARYTALKSRKADREKQLPGSDKDNGNCTLEDVRRNAVDHLTTKDNSMETVAGSYEKATKVYRRKLLKERSRHCNQKRLKDSLLTDSQKDVEVEFGDDVSLMKLLKARIREKKANSMSRGGFQEAEGEMERLCKIKSRLETVKQRLLRLSGGKGKNADNSLMLEQSVIYVPVAELREKV